MADLRRLPRWRPGGAVPAPPDDHPPRPLPIPASLVLAALSGAALWLSFPSFAWWPLAPFGVAGLTVAVRGARPAAGAVFGLVTGLACFLPTLHWSGVYVGTLPWAALSVLEAAYVALLGGVLPLAWQVRRGGVTGRAGTVLAVTGLWVGQEALRGRTPFGGFPWARLAFSQADAPTLGLAALGGAPLVTAAVAATGGCLAVAVAVVIDATRRDREAVREALQEAVRPALAAVGAGLLVFGVGALVPRPTSSARSLQAAAVQGNVPRAGLEFNAQRRAVLDNHRLATVRLAEQVRAGRATQPDLVLWPENSSDIDPLRNADAATVISDASDRVGVPILIGAVLQAPAGRLANAAIVWGPTGSAHPGPGATYLKRHPAPFAEYIPFRAFFRVFSDKVDLVRADFLAGDRMGLLTVGPARLGDVICFEVAYDALVRDPVRNGAEILVVQTNNATFGFTDESVQQLAMSRLRAVETGRAVVHISTVGVSGLILPDGRLVAGSELFTQQVLQARLPLRTQQTVATRLGALPEVLLTGLGLILAGTAIRRRLPARRHPLPAPTDPNIDDPGGAA